MQDVRGVWGRIVDRVLVLVGILKEMFQLGSVGVGKRIVLIWILNE